MSTKIEWTDETINPQAGCDRACRGCDNCYAIRMAVRQMAQGNLKYDNVIARNHLGKWDWSGRVNFLPEIFYKGVNALRKPSLIFLNSMSDTFHRNVADSTIDRYISRIRQTPQHAYQVLTKRSKRIAGLKIDWPDNLWLGVSVCDKGDLGKIDDLKRAGAKVKFLSLEPLIEVLGTLDLDGIDWVIVGGESGPGARKMEVEWVRSIRDQCIAAGVPMFFKQWGDAHATWQVVDGSRRKIKAQHTVDGLYWLQFPTSHLAAERKRRQVNATYEELSLAPEVGQTDDKHQIRMT